MCIKYNWHVMDVPYLKKHIVFDLLICFLYDATPALQLSIIPTTNSILDIISCIIPLPIHINHVQATIPTPGLYLCVHWSLCNHHTSYPYAVSTPRVHSQPCILCGFELYHSTTQDFSQDFTTGFSNFRPPETIIHN